ncbi:MAG: acyl-CoA dehydrogenase family protein [Hyphomonadaceae bacterium]
MRIWCQLFSEPSAGSDVAAGKTKAVRDGDDWIVNGQKVWTTGAQFSDFGILLVRTNPDVEKHKGLTMFIVDAKQKGVESGRSTKPRAAASSTKSTSPCAHSGFLAPRRARAWDGTSRS